MIRGALAVPATITAEHNTTTLYPSVGGDALNAACHLDRDNDNGQSFYVFGYGSLAWRPNFKFESSNVGFIDGYRRRFYQLSRDHRGTEANPGRVVTLVPVDNESSAQGCAGRVYGVVYRVRGELREHTIENLDFREQGGYSRLLVKVRIASSETTTVLALTYVATKSNPCYAEFDDRRQDELHAVCRQIVNAGGISGRNYEYIAMLSKFMRTICQTDDHLDLIAAECERQANHPGDDSGVSSADL